MSETEHDSNIVNLHTTRAAIAAATQRAQELASKINRGAGGREVALTITKLQEAEMWLSEALYVVLVSKKQEEKHVSTRID